MSPTGPVTVHKYDPLGIYGSSARVFELLTARTPDGAQAVAKVLKELVADGRKEVRDIFPEEQSDPGQILLEVFSLLHWNALRFLEEEARGLLAAALALTGLQRRPAWPAAVVFRTRPAENATARELPVDVSLAPPPEIVKDARFGSDPPRFRPAWPSFAHALGNSDSWNVTGLSRATPFDLFVKPLTDDGEERDTILESLWAGSWGCGRTSLRVSHQCDGEASADHRFLVPGVWPADTDAPARDSAAWIRRQFLRLQPANDTTAKGPITFTPPGGGATALSGHVWTGGGFELIPNATLWIDWRGAPSGGPAISAPDYPGASATPRGDSRGAAANLAKPDPGEKEWPVEGSPDFVSAARVTAAVGGRDAESDTDFLRRAPLVLRTAGAPVSARDWQALVKDLEPGGRIQDVVARPAYFADGFRTTAGIDLAFSCPGGPAECGGVARDLAPVLRKRLEVLRPLGTGVRLFYPSFTRGRVVIRAGDNAKETFRDERRQWLAVRLAPAGATGREQFWGRALAEFRRGMAERDFPVRLARYLLDTVLLLSKGAYSAVWFEPNGPPSEPNGEIHLPAWGLEWRQAEAAL